MSKKIFSIISDDENTTVEIEANNKMDLLMVIVESMHQDRGAAAFILAAADTFSSMSSGNKPMISAANEEVKEQQ